MELCWLCAWANFLAVSTTQISFPLGIACATFFLALFLGDFFTAKGCRRIWVILGHILGPGIMIGAAVSAATGWAFLFAGSPYQWYQVFLIVVMVCLFWYKGAKLSARQLTYKTVCNYFDLGISLLFLLVMIKLLIHLKAGIVIQESLTLYSMAGVFLFGLLAIFFSRNPSDSKKQYLEGFRMYGAVISVAIAFLLCAMGIIFVLLPFMTFFAESGFLVLKQAAGPLSPYLIAILKFVFSVKNHPEAGRISLQNPGGSTSNSSLLPVQAGWTDHLVINFILAVFFLTVLFMISYGVYRLFKFLMSKQPLAPVDKEKEKLFLRLIRWLFFLFASSKYAILAVTRKTEDAGKGFARLIFWGHKSGMPKFSNETPAEYAKRLEHRFVPLEKEIRTIVHAFHLETYGEARLDQAQILKMVKALNKLHSPFFWLLRIKALCRIR